METLEKFLSVKYLTGIGFVSAILAHGFTGDPALWRASWFLLAAHFLSHSYPSDF